MVGDESAAIENGAAGFVAEEVGVDVCDTEGARSFDHEMLAHFLFSEGEVACAGIENDVDSAT